MTELIIKKRKLIVKLIKVLEKLFEKISKKLEEKKGFRFTWRTCILKFLGNVYG